MPKVLACIHSYPNYVSVVFMDPQNTQRQIGRSLKLADEERVFEMLRRAHANLETRNLLEMAFRERRPCWLTLELTDEQYRKL